MASVLDLVKHYQQAIEKHSNDEERVLRCIDKLYQLKVTTQHLQETGVGRTVNALRKEPGDVGKAARSLVYKWKLMVAAEESDQEEDQRTDTAKHNGHSSGKESDENTHSRSNKYDQYRNENPNPTVNKEYQKRTNGHHSGSKRKHHSSEEEEPYSKKIRNSTSSEDDKRRVAIKQEKLSDSESEDESESSDSDSNSEDSESSKEEIKIKKEIKQEDYESSKEEIRIKKEIKQEGYKSSKDEIKIKKEINQEDYLKKEIKLEFPESHKSSSSKHNDHHRVSSSKHSHETEKRDHERSKSKELSRRSSEDKNKHERTEKKHKSDHKTQDERKESKSSKSSSDKHRSSSKKHESHSNQHKNDSDRNGSDKHSSKPDKHRSSSHSDRENKESHKHRSSDRDSKQRSKESSSSREKHSSSNKDKSKDRSSATREKSSHSSEKKSSSDSKSNDKSRHDKKHEKSKEKSSSSHRSKSSSSLKEEVPKKKSKPDGGNSDDDGIDCGSGASFAEALGMLSPAKPKKKTYKDLSPTSSDLSPAALLAPTAKLAPLPALEISALPEISPNYRPRPPPKLLPHFTEEEAISAGISSKNQRTKVYSGNKVVGKVTSLYEMCVHVLQEHIDALEYTGGVPYEILKPVVDRATPQQLFLLEHYNPYLMEDTDHLWQMYCEKSFRNKKRQEMETWREMYMRCQEEQECKLKSLTANIRMTQEAKKAPIKQTKMAYVDSVVKPPRNIARKQALHGTAHAATASPAARVASLASASNVLKGGARPSPAPVISSTSFKPKKAPLMQKALQFMRGRKR